MALTQAQLNAHLVTLFRTLLRNLGYLPNPGIIDEVEIDPEVVDIILMRLVKRIVAYAETGGPGSEQWEAATFVLQKLAEDILNTTTLSAGELHVINNHWQQTLTVT